VSAYSNSEYDRSSGAKLLCAIDVQVADGRTKKLSLYENEEPKRVVRDFGRRFDLSAGTRQRLLDEIYIELES